MREREVAVGRQQLEGMINSPDTSVQITAPRQDGPKDGGMEREQRSIYQERRVGGGDITLLEMTQLDFQSDSTSDT